MSSWFAENAALQFAKSPRQRWIADNDVDDDESRKWIADDDVDDKERAADEEVKDLSMPKKIRQKEDCQDYLEMHNLRFATRS